MIAEVYFRIDTEAVSHQRQSFSFINFMGDVGGIKDILIAMISFFYGGYAQFQVEYTRTQYLYKVQDYKGLFNQSKDQDKR